RYYQPGQGRFLTMDTWKGDQNLPMSLNPWLYTYGNPVNYTDPSGLWTCRGHQDCNEWVENVLHILSITSKTGKAIVEFFHEHDERIRKTQPLEYYESCQDLPIQSNGVLIEFGKPWPGPSWGTALFIDILQLSDDPRVINSPNPDGFGLQLFGHEVSHWAQGPIRFTIQGELLARFVEQQLRNDLQIQYGNIDGWERTKELTERFNPFDVQHLQLAKFWMINNFSPGYAVFPLPSIGGLNQSWLDRFSINIDLPKPPFRPTPRPGPTPPQPPIPIGTPIPPSLP
ncbi:MAG: hypothetical protein IBX69_18095, partial [Anaerolineales bacterium]|nr:hypothetical protein [Anaerolineales bacterium]